MDNILYKMMMVNLRNHLKNNYKDGEPISEMALDPFSMSEVLSVALAMDKEDILCDIIDVKRETMSCGNCYKYVGYIGETSGKCIKLQRIVNKDDKCHSEFPLKREVKNGSK